MATLLQIEQDMDALDALLMECDGDITDPTVEAEVMKWAQEIEARFDAKADGYAALIMECKLRAKARKEEAERLALRAKIDENKAKFLSERIKAAMEKRGTAVVETARYRLTVAGNGGKAPMRLLVAEPEKLPQWAQRIKVEANTEAIRERIEAGEKVEFAVIEPRGTHLRIK